MLLKIDLQINVLSRKVLQLLDQRLVLLFHALCLLGTFVFQLIIFLLHALYR